MVWWEYGVVWYGLIECAVHVRREVCSSKRPPAQCALASTPASVEPKRDAPVTAASHGARYRSESALHMPVPAVVVTVAVVPAVAVTAAMITAVVLTAAVVCRPSSGRTRRFCPSSCRNRRCRRSPMKMRKCE